MGECPAALVSALPVACCRSFLCVQEVVDSEESIWSTKFGIKGMIDVSARLALAAPARVPQRAQQPGGFLQAGAQGQGQQGKLTGADGAAELVVGPLVFVGMGLMAGLQGVHLAVLAIAGAAPSPPAAPSSARPTAISAASSPSMNFLTSPNAFRSVC